LDEAKRPDGVALGGMLENGVSPMRMSSSAGKKRIMGESDGDSYQNDVENEGENEGEDTGVVGQETRRRSHSLEQLADAAIAEFGAVPAGDGLHSRRTTKLTSRAKPQDASPLLLRRDEGSRTSRAHDTFRAPDDDPLDALSALHGSPLRTAR